MFTAITKFWSSQVGFPFDVQKVELELDNHLADHLDEVFTGIQNLQCVYEELTVKFVPLTFRLGRLIQLESKFALKQTSDKCFEHVQSVIG